MDTNPLVTGLGVTSLTLGFAARDIAANLMSGAHVACDGRGDGVQGWCWRSADTSGRRARASACTPRAATSSSRVRLALRIAGDERRHV